MVKRIVIALIVVFLMGGAAGSWAASHWHHWEAALDDLRHAKMELEKAEHNFGGHRDKALEHVQRAIEETRKGVEYNEREHEREHEGDHEGDHRY
jgi:hypothetical protein